MDTSADSKFIYKYEEPHLKYMKVQIGECKDDLNIYSAVSEYEYSFIKDYIGHPKVVLELGCGLGRVSIYLNHMLTDPKPYFILADTNDWTIGNRDDYGGYDVKEYYNDLALTSSFAELNGLVGSTTFDVMKKSLSTLGYIDLVISCCAFGMHIPIEPVMPTLLQITQSNCTMIFGTRNRAVYSQDSFQESFSERYFLPQKPQPPFPQEDWLILKGKIV